MSEATVLIRADANVAIGTGHVMRSLALAQAWQDQGGRAIFVSAEISPAIRRRLAEEGFLSITIPASRGAFDDAAATIQAARVHEAAWIVIDGYAFGIEFQRAIQSAGFKILCIDDGCDSTAFAADIVLNPNLHADKIAYERTAPETRILRGTKFALLRREFAGPATANREVPEKASRLLVTMGGSDPENLTLTAIQAACSPKCAGLEVIVVAGGSNPHVSGLQCAIGKNANLRLHVDPRNMPELMAWADLAVAAAGSTTWELCALGVPSILTDAALNQVAVARELAQRGIASFIPRTEFSAARLAESVRILAESAPARQLLSDRACQLLDGKGAARVVSAMRLPALRLRPARISDCRRIWEWASDAGVRTASFSPESIPWEKHSAWFREKIASPKSLILIAETSEGEPLGQFRVDLQNADEGEVDVSIADKYRGRGYGSWLIDCGARETFAQTSATKLYARIRAENEASRRAFEQAHFRRVPGAPVRGYTAVHYLRAREPQLAQEEQPNHGI
jgi:UDP-2,4-diacetamido-2,4,6-trideoxy-beta-L-altropyranose hydrolase